MRVLSESERVWGWTWCALQRNFYADTDPIRHSPRFQAEQYLRWTLADTREWEPGKPLHEECEECQKSLDPDLVCAISAHSASSEGFAGGAYIAPFAMCAMSAKSRARPWVLAVR